jgi:hypothetical protein
MQEEQNVVRHQAPPRQHFDREEIGSGEHVHMPADELLPGRGLTPFGSRCDVVAAQDVAHSLVRDVIAEVRQRAHDPVVTPAGVLPGHAHNQGVDSGVDTRSAWIRAAFGSVELLCDQPSVPGEDGVGFGHVGYFFQSFAPESFADVSQRATLRIRQVQPCRQVCAENTVLRSEVLVL